MNTALTLYHADPAGFWRGSAAVLALVAMLPFVAAVVA